MTSKEIAALKDMVGRVRRMNVEISELQSELRDISILDLGSHNKEKAMEIIDAGFDSATTGLRKTHNALLIIIREEDD